MEESEHNLRIEKIAELILSDNISLDEQDQNKLKKYHRNSEAKWSKSYAMCN